MNKKMLVPTAVWFAMLSSQGVFLFLISLLPKGPGQPGLEFLQTLGFAMLAFGIAIGSAPQIWKNPTPLGQMSDTAIPSRLIQFYIVALVLTDMSGVMGFLLHLLGISTDLSPKMNIVAAALGFLVLRPTPQRLGLAPNGPSNKNPMVKID